MTSARDHVKGNDPFQGCTEVFVGGGWAGVYSFYRRVLEEPSLASSRCLFEASWRVGGRTYSVSINNTKFPFVQDVGAYRFTPDMHVVGDLILNQLELPTECYQAGCPSAKDDFPKPFLFNYSAPLRRIVDLETKLPSGYVTAIHRMIVEAERLGARVFTQTKLAQFDLIEPTGSDAFVQLSFEDAVTGAVYTLPRNASYPIDVLVLNLPRNKFFEVGGIKESLEPSVSDTIECIVFDTPAELFGEEIAQEVESARHFTTNLGKAYLFYDDAFWRSKLHQDAGTWPPDVGFAAVETKEGVRLNVRWYDGPVVCENEGQNGTEPSCMGLLELYYSVSNETFYSALPATPDEPLGSIWETDGPEARAILERAHMGLVDSLQPLLDADGIDASTLKLPSGLIVGIWHRPNEDFPLGQGYTAPTKVLYYPNMSGTPDQACGVSGLSDSAYRDSVLQPWRQHGASGKKQASTIRDRIFLVNNDYSCMDVRYYWGDWAEESLMQAERAMLLLGMAPPKWLQNKDYYHANVVSQVYISKKELLTTRTSNIENGLLEWFFLPAALVATILAIVCLVKKKKCQSGEYTPIP